MRFATLLALCGLFAALSVAAAPTPSVLDSVLPQPRGAGGCGVDKSPGCYGPNRLRIGVVTLGTTRAAASSRVTAFINEMYTARHGYDFIVERCAASTRVGYLWADNSQYQIVWSKSLFMLKHLPYYDYLMFMDGDAYFVNHTLTIESFIDTYFTADVSLAFTSNCYDSTPGPFGCWDAKEINTGIFIAKNTPTAVDILTQWATAPDDERCARFHNQHPREQLCMNAVAVNYTHGEIAVVDSDLWRGLDGQWIVHGYEGRAPTWFLGEVTKSFAYLLHSLNPEVYDIVKQWPSLSDNTADPPWSTHPGRTWL